MANLYILLNDDRVVDQLFCMIDSFFSVYYIYNIFIILLIFLTFYLFLNTSIEFSFLVEKDDLRFIQIYVRNMIYYLYDSFFLIFHNASYKLNLPLSFHLSTYNLRISCSWFVHQNVPSLELRDTVKGYRMIGMRSVDWWDRARGGIVFRGETTSVIGHVSCTRWGKFSISLYTRATNGTVCDRAIMYYSERERILSYYNFSF